VVSTPATQNPRARPAEPPARSGSRVFGTQRLSATCGREKYGQSIVVQIHNLYRGHAQQVAAALWGMIGYLPGHAQERLLDTITALSAPGSQLSADYLPSRSKSIGSMILDTAKGWKEQGFDVDFGTLTFSHDRSDVVARLQTHGWQTTARGLVDLLNDAGVSDHTMDTGPNGQARSATS
jgi:hypothetical protein